MKQPRNYIAKTLYENPQYKPVHEPKPLTPQWFDWLLEEHNKFLQEWQNAWDK